MKFKYNVKRSILFLWIILSLIIVLFDQFSKIIILKTFTQETQYILTSFFNLVLVCNSGTAFGFLEDNGIWKNWILISIGIIVIFLICYLLKNSMQDNFLSLSLSLILGGALSNVMNRISYGFVIDFLDLHIGLWHWPVFNLADCAITIGTVLLLYRELRSIRIHSVD